MINVMWFYTDKFGCGTFRVYFPAYSLEASKQFANSFIWNEQCTRVQDYFPDLVECKTHVVVLQRPITAIYEQVIKDCKWRGIKVVIEVDDNLFDIPRHHPAAWLWRKKGIKKKFRDYLAQADAVIVSTDPLKQVIAEEVPAMAQSIHVCPNHLHEVAWGPEIVNLSPKEKHDNGGQIIIGWQGSTTHDTDFKVALPALKRIITENANVQIRLFGDVPRSIQNEIPGDRFQFTSGVPYEMYPRKLAYCNFDIGIAPLTDSNLNRSKSNIKWMEYGAVQVPCVASKVYPYEKTINQGIDGYLASNDQEWYDALNALITDPHHRRAMGGAAYDAVWSKWSAKQHAHKWADLFTQLVKKPE